MVRLFGSKLQRKTSTSPYGVTCLIGTLYTGLEVKVSSGFTSSCVPWPQNPVEIPMAPLQTYNSLRAKIADSTRKN